ncbi:hypothetical protein D3867_23880 (plasmid) [Azospirillum argentinense]|uniref:Uncharacterized protein n=1 Tax=Azospirillum brasilense TaxID=192 RepID=A0A4D8QCT1_AZOBR|nr:hypothetical protein D3867_23880 [Azospirillum argentinense]
MTSSLRIEFLDRLVAKQLKPLYCRCAVRRQAAEHSSRISFDQLKGHQLLVRLRIGWSRSILPVTPGAQIKMAQGSDVSAVEIPRHVSHGGAASVRNGQGPFGQISVALPVLR